MTPWSFQKVPEDPGEGGCGGWGWGWGPGDLPWSLEMLMPDRVLGDAAAWLGHRQATCCSLWFPARASETGRAPEQWALLPPRLTDQRPGQKLQSALRRPHGRMQEPPHVPKLLPVHLPCVWNARLAKALAAGRRALPEGMAAPSPGLASMPGSQNRPPDLTARYAQDSLAPGPKLRSLASGADQARVGTTSWVSTTCDSVYSGGAVFRVWPLPPWAARC